MCETNSLAKILYEKIRELEQEIAKPEDIDLYTKLEGLLRSEVDKKEDLDYAGVCQDSDAELERSDDDSVYSETEVSWRRSLPYDFDKQFEIVMKRDHNGWSYSIICNRYKRIDSGDYGRLQLHRMRKNIKRGGISSRDLYRKLRENVWREVERLDKDMITLHDRDIQEIAVIETEKVGLNDFTASTGWIYYFKRISIWLIEKLTSL